MKIWGDISRITGIYDKNKSFSKIEKSGGVAPKKDVVSISGNAKDFQTALKAVRETPDIRKQKVDEIKEQFDAGTYNVTGKEVADKILRSFLDKKV